VSAVIYAAIVVMWAVVLVPMWLRRHDAATESRSVDRFSTAMRTLSRRTSGTPGRRYVVMPRRSDSGMSVHVSGAAVPETGRRTDSVRPAAPQPISRPAKPRPTPVQPRGEKASIVARRRRLLLGLLGLTFFTMLLAFVGVISWPLQIVVDVILVAFCVHLRAQAKRSVALARQRRQAAIAAQLPVPAAAPRRSVPAAAPVEPSRPVAEPVVAEAYAAESFAAEATGTDDAMVDDDTWEPVPVPRPTYTMKPPAPAYEADPTYSPPVYERATSEDEPTEEIVAVESDLDEILERRWAVND
jgi:hypothetical protein